MQSCPVCGSRRITEYPTSTDSRRIDCSRCGEFDISRSALAMIPDQLSQGVHRASLMSHALRRMGTSTGSPPPLITSDMFDSFWPVDQLPEPSKQADDLILFAGDKQLSADSPAVIASDFLGAWIGTSVVNSPDPNPGLSWLFGYLRRAGLLSGIFYSQDGALVCNLQLTMEGWKRLSELKERRINSKTAFMAMKFGDPDLDDAVETCFKPAVARTGFELKKLTDSQPAGLIDDQIRASILSGRFVIADLTHGSYGAYWEAGFAEGLNLPVIYTCEKSAWEAKKTHFDTNHLLTIIWDTSDLSKAGRELTATIRATLRTEARQAD